ncbi:PepSY-associated TM helix domain-containing protein [Sphingomonas sp. RS2018]
MAQDPYRAVWRWHFWAGLLVLPFLAWLATTGALYLYKGEIEELVYARWMHVAPAGETLPIATLTDRVERATGGRVTQVTQPAPPDASWRMTLVQPGGAKRTAFVDPHNGAVLGTTGAGGIVATIRTLHSLAITGPIGNAAIEIVGGWTIILVATGFYLWWPRRGGRAIALRGPPAKRMFWRDLHASTGLIAGAVVLFLAVSGMPWSVVWGKSVQGWMTEHGINRPAAPVPGGEHRGHDVAATLPWSMQAVAPPMSGHGQIGPDAAVAAAARAGLTAPFTLTMPTAPGAPYLVSATLTRAQDAHVVYVDAGNGRVLQNARFGDFGSGARTVEWAAAVHMGQQYGEPNRMVMLGGCIASLLLCVSAPVMWWKRRPAGRISAPRARSGAGLVAIMAVAGVVFPLTGLTMVAAWVVERVVGRTAVHKRRVPAQAGA